MNDYQSISEDTILLGDDADQFFKSDLGKYIQARARHEIITAQNDLVKVDPEDSKAIREIQNRIKIARAVPDWLNEAILSGRQELEQKFLEEEEI